MHILKSKIKSKEDNENFLHEKKMADHFNTGDLGSCWIVNNPHSSLLCCTDWKKAKNLAFFFLFILFFKFWMKSYVEKPPERVTIKKILETTIKNKYKTKKCKNKFLEL